MAEEIKKKLTKDEIVKGKIANALTSAAMNHIVATTDDIYDIDLEAYQNEINKWIHDIDVITEEELDEMLIPQCIEGNKMDCENE